MKIHLILTLSRVCDHLVQLTSRNPLLTKGLECISCMCPPPISTGGIFLTSCKAVGRLFLPSEKRNAPLDSAPWAIVPISLVRKTVIISHTPIKIASLIKIFLKIYFIRLEWNFNIFRSRNNSVNLNIACSNITSLVINILT